MNLADIVVHEKLSTCAARARAETHWATRRTRDLLFRANSRLLWWPRIGVAVVLLMGASLRCARGAAADELKRRFITEAPSRWEEYVAEARKLQGKSSWLWTDYIEDRVRARSSVDIRQNGMMSRLVREESGPEQHGSFAYVNNDVYAFDLIRSGTAGPWVLARLERELTAEIVDSPWFKTGHEHVIRTACAGLAIDSEFLPEMASAPSFVVKDVVAVKDHDRPLVQVFFDFVPVEVEDGNHRTRGGWVTLDPERFWTIAQFEVDAVWPDGKGTISGRNEYATSELAVPTVKEHRTRWQCPAASKGETATDHEWVGTYEWTVDADVPRAEFTLAAFDLPEPPGRSAHTAALIGVLAIGALLIAAAAWLRNRAVQRDALP